MQVADLSEDCPIEFRIFFLLQIADYFKSEVFLESHSVDKVANES
jgi:hypothetical protein